MALAHKPIGRILLAVNWQHFAGVKRVTHRSKLHLNQKKNRKERKGREKWLRKKLLTYIIYITSLFCRAFFGYWKNQEIAWGLIIIITDKKPFDNLCTQYWYISSKIHYEIIPKYVCITLYLKSYSFLFLHEVLISEICILQKCGSVFFSNYVYFYSKFFLTL